VLVLALPLRHKHSHSLPLHTPLQPSQHPLLPR